MSRYQLQILDFRGWTDVHEFNGHSTEIPNLEIGKVILENLSNQSLGTYRILDKDENKCVIL